MKRTISAMVGKGSVTHNSRTFTAENVDSERTHLNIDYCNEPIKKVYTNLLTSCKLTSYLADINEQAEEMFFRLVKQLSEKEGVTEQLKAENQMLWGAGLRWRPLPEAEAPTEPTGETAYEQYPQPCNGNR